MAAIRTKGGRLVDPFNLTQEDVRSVDFIHALSCINRYTGWAKYPYSVGQHTFTLSRHVPQRLRKAALIHDFAETFFNDLASPVKREFPNYEHAECNALEVIANVHEVTWSELEEVSPYDKALYIDERNVLFDDLGPTMGMGDDRIGLEVDPWFFRERQWRDVYMDLSNEYSKVFLFHGK